VAWHGGIIMLGCGFQYLSPFLGTLSNGKIVFDHIQCGNPCSTLAKRSKHFMSSKFECLFGFSSMTTKENSQ